MAEGTGELTVAQRLGQLLDRGLLPAGGPAEAAERLIERLERPARVALLGLPGSGKSAILNLLAGSVVVPETLRLPTIIVQHGAEPRMICTLTDGRTKALPGTDLADVLTLAPALVTVELDLPALKVINLLEVSAGPMEAEQRRAATWASKRADIIIWCTTSYLPKEQLIWDSMPDVVKDNGFLFLTKTDLLGSRDAATGMLDRVEQRAGEDFRHVLAISAKQARAAIAPDGTVDRAMFRDSGAAAVISTIKSRVQAANRADTDTAELLLARHVEASSIVAKRFAEPSAAPSAEPSAEPGPGLPQAPRWAPPPDVQTSEPPREEPKAPISTPVPDPVEEPMPSEPVQAAERDGVVTPDVGDLDVVEEVVSTGSAPDLPSDESDFADTAEPPQALTRPDAAAAVDLDVDPEPRLDPAAQPDQEPAATVAKAARDFAAPPGAKRFTDRIRQAGSPEETAQPPVPLKSTWKSRAETEAAKAVKPSPGATEAEFAADEPVTPDREPPGEDSAAAEGPRAVVERPQRETGRPRPGIAPRPSPQAQSKSPFGSRRVLDEPPADLSALRSVLSAPREAAEDEAAADDLAEEQDAPEAVAATDISTESDAPPDEVDEAAVVDEAPVEVDPEPAPEVQQVQARPEVFARRPAVATANPPTPPAPQIANPSPRVAVLRDRRPEPATTDAPVRRERPRVMSRPAAVSAPVPVAVPASEHGVLDHAITIIMDRSAELGETIDPDEKVPVDMVLDHARETIDQVLSILSSGSSSELRRISADFQEALDLVLLMQLEKGHAPADDAMTVILQLRRDLETLRAA
jgi:hypothetical protein